MVVEREYKGPVEGVIADLRSLHGFWMQVAFPQLRREHAVMGRWRPDSGVMKGLYYVWAAVGAIGVAVAYPFLIGGLATRFYSRRFDNAASRIGLVGVIVLTAVVWGSLTLLARIQFSAEGFAAVAAASVVAVVSAALAVVFTQIDGRATTVVLAYPSAMNAIFLPPVVAALYSETLASTIFPGSTSLARWLLDNVLFIGGFNAWIRATFELTGANYVIMWFLIAVPIGWFLGLLVTLADTIRPKPRADDEDASAS